MILGWPPDSLMFFRRRTRKAAGGRATTNGWPGLPLKLRGAAQRPSEASDGNIIAGAFPATSDCCTGAIRWLQSGFSS